MANVARGYKEIKIANFSSQQKEQRFPSLDEHYEPLGSPDFEEDLMHSDDEDGQPPRIAEWRSNLVTLSLRYNLYFAAYQDRIHVSIPRGLKQTLRGNADLVIELPVSEQAGRVGGYIDDLRPHCVNHMIVGDFGTYEILLMSCDDGDVLAFYTHIIWNAIESKSNMGHSGRSIIPFFHENVGISAWGLAIHQESRLIAVSSNLRQVTVFVPAYTIDNKREPHELPLNSFIELAGVNNSSPATRHRNFRRVLKLGPEGHNIPSIDFASGIDGEAKSILAVDIQGKLWILDIWSDEKELIPSVHRTESRHGGQMGWGVLSIPLDAFKQTSTPQEALGMLDIQAALAVDQLGQNMETFFNVKVSGPEPVVSHKTSALTLEKENDENAGSFDATELSSNGDGPYDSVIEELGIGNQNTVDEEGLVNVSPVIRNGRRLPSTDEAGTLLSSKHMPDSLKKALVSNQRLATECFRFIVNMPVGVANTIKSSDDLAKLLAQHMELASKGIQFPMEKNQTGDEYQPLYRLPDRSAIIRTYQFDIELIPCSKNMPKSLLRKVVKRNLPPTLGMLGPFERLCFVKLIPELSLLVIGSQAGRVALISLTRPQISSPNGPVVNFRLESILPRKEEEDQGLRPNLPLFGVAVGPLQVARRGSGPKRWRLILHYYDHTVLSYEVSREEGLVLELL